MAEHVVLVTGNQVRLCVERSQFINLPIMFALGGTGLVGKAIEHVVEEERKNGTLPKGAKERFVYLSSKDGDLRSREQTDAIFAKHKYEIPAFCESGSFSHLRNSALLKGKNYSFHLFYPL